MTVGLHGDDGPDQKDDLDEVVPRGEGLHPREDLADPVAQLHVVGVVVGRVVDGLVDALERGLGPAVGEVAAVVRYEGLRGIASRECLEEDIDDIGYNLI